MKIVTNSCYGESGLSHKTITMYLRKKSIKFWVEKTDSALVPYEYQLVPKSWG